MGIKDLFDKGHSLKLVKNKTKQDLRENLESDRFIDAYSQKRGRFIPDVDFATASNFARFGLAEEYYDTAIKRIYETYPYDGSRAEKLEWEHNSTYLDLFIFDNEYPRTNGFVTFNSSSQTYTATAVSNIYSSSAPEYIYFKGGPNADPNEDYKSDFSAGPSGTGVSKANIFHTGTQRTNNLELDLAKGVTVEFWMKKDNWFEEGQTRHEYFFNLAALGTAADTANPAKYANLSVRSHGGTTASKKTMFFDIQSGSVSVNFEHDTGLTDSSGIADGEWHHYALTAKTTGSVTIGHLYVDGIHKSAVENSNTINAVEGKMVAALGALADQLGDGTGAAPFADVGYGNVVSCSFDEFRYWKTERDSQQVGRYYRDQIAGGTNTDNSKYDDISNKVDLGVYFKFNEGIVGDSAIDSTVLDYSGRISNGAFINYSTTTSRNTGSAIITAGAASKEFKDPIIYSTHPDVAALAYNKQISGSAYDHENSVSLYKSVPGWILEDDEKNSNHLKYLTQILASYFDDLYLQIEKLSRLKDINYPDDTSYEKPLPFADRLLSSRGYEPPELFADAHELAKYLNRGEKKLFEKKLYEIKNIIYQNIYNNLSYIQKSKGTFKSLRNFLRCFGVDEELIKLNLYAVDDVYEFKDNITSIAIRKKYVDFDDLETRLTASEGLASAYSANAYQYYDADDANSLSYIPASPAGTSAGASMTIEAEVIFPKRKIGNDKNYATFPSLTSSIFGMHRVNASNTNLDFAGSDTLNFNVVALKSDNDRRNVRFGLHTNGSTVFSSELENSTSFRAVYNNEKWNLAFRLRPTKTPTDSSSLIDTLDGFLEPSATSYTYELYGVNYISNVLRDEFTLSGTMSTTEAASFFENPKRIFIGAKRDNFTGDPVVYSDVKVSSTRVWLDYLSDETIRGHAKNALSYGALHPYKNSDDSYSSNFVPEIKTLVLNWTMDNVTGSNASGQFLIEDFASGSTTQKFGDNWARPISAYNYTGRGDNFTTNTNFSDQAVDVEFVPSGKNKLPEVVNSDDMVKILNKQDDVVFTRDTTYVQHLFSVEKSMYQIVSEEMLRLFATVKDFNNLVGEPVNRYRPNYKKLEKLRELFFLSVENDSMDLEKFIEYFKWIDDAVAIMIAQLIPVSSNKIELLRNMVEGHILERNKYWTKFPTLEIKTKEPVASLKAIEELKYNWKFGHAPLAADPNTNQNLNCLWWKQRAERAQLVSSSASSADSNRDSLLKIIVTEVSGTEPTLKTIDGTKYRGTYYYNRSLARPVDYLAKRSLSLGGGGNSLDNKLHDFYKSTIKWGSDDDFIYLDFDNLTKNLDCDDQTTPPELNKEKIYMKSLVFTGGDTTKSDAYGKEEKELKYDDAKSSLLTPFSMFSSSLSTGYQGVYGNQFNVDFTNIHEDKYGPSAEIPMQGPFSEKYVGGMQHRHVEINRGTDTELTRPEGWHLQWFLDLSSDQYVMKEDFTSVTNTTRHEDPSRVDPSMVGSVPGDPSPHEYWTNKVGADNPWAFISGPTPTIGTGPATGADGGTDGFAYCEVLPSRQGQTFSIVTPLIDLLDVSDDSSIKMTFKYHMFGDAQGSLKVQASLDKTFETGVTDLVFYWSTLGALSTEISGKQHAADTSAWATATASSDDTSVGTALKPFLGKRFYIRFFYTATARFEGDCAIDKIYIFKDSSEGVYQNSFKLLSPTHDNHHRPRAVYTRDTMAKRPVNIRNILMTGSSPTVAGNFLNRYEYVNTVSPEANDPWFVKNVDSVKRITSEVLGLGTGSIEEILSSTPSLAQNRTNLKRINYELPNRDHLTGSVKNKTRIRTRFSSPGGFETLSRGFLDPAHETYSLYNVMTFRNLWSRTVHNTQMQAHCGQFGVSTHDATTARVYGSEAVGSITLDNYEITGDASKHKIHRNNIERLKFSSADASSDFQHQSVVTASVFDNAFVSHMIPRTDNQTRWITASLI